VRRGLSLLETILALSLVSLVLILVISLFPDTLLAIRRSEQTVQADQWAQTLLEYEMSRPFDELVAGSVYSPPDRQLGATLYHGTTRIFAVPNARGDLIKGVNVTVGWDHGGKNHLSEYQCLVSNIER
jgi:Tfp pilus assembly protein PilV